MALKYQPHKTWHVSTCGEHSETLTAALQGIENQGGEVVSILPYGHSYEGHNGYAQVGHGYRIVYYTTDEPSVIKGFTPNVENTTAKLN
jgi:long-subunit acyl-CoA synthetase (AMP-forming)